jgi:Carboxypeptidase regulatory-like domain
LSLLDDNENRLIPLRGRCSMCKLTAACITACLVLATASIALCGDIAGSVSDAQGHPIGDVQISARTPAGHAVGQAVTDASGKYWIAGLNPATYHFVLDPLRTRYKGGNAVSYLDPRGLTLNWKVSLRTEAIAFASLGSTDLAFAGDPFGLTASEFAGLALAGTSLVSVGVVGGLNAAGGFSGPSRSPASPSH